MDSTCTGGGSANPAHNQHRRQEIFSDPLPAFPCTGSSFQRQVTYGYVHSSRLCAGRATTRTRPLQFSATAKTTSTPTTRLYGESNRHVTHKRKHLKVPLVVSVRVRSRPCGIFVARLPILLFQLILILSTFIMNDAQGDDRSMMQWSIGEFQLDLKPTPDTLYNPDNIVGPSIERVVRDAMQQHFGGSFIYMYVASLGHVQEVPATSRQGQEEPMTSLYYNGGVVAFETPGPTADINAIIKSSLEANLTQELAPHGESWALIQSVTFTSLDDTDNPNNPNGDGGLNAGPPAPGSGPITTTPPPTTLRPTPAPTSAPTVPTAGGVSAIEGNGQSTNTTQSESKASAPQIVASGFGIAFVMIGVTLFIKATRRRQTHVREVALSLEEADSEGSEEGGEGTKDPSAPDLGAVAPTTIISSDAQDAYNAHPSNAKFRNSSSRSRGIGGGGGSAAYVFEDNTDDEDRSEMAQYSTGEWMESTSVAQSVTSSDFTLNTLDDATYSALADNSIGRQQRQHQQPHSQVHPDTSNRVAVMGFASSETFERDRRVTLHKDMLQSEWGTPLAAHGHITYATANNATIVRPTGGGGVASMSFEEAYHEGGDNAPREEVFILPPPPSNTSKSRRKDGGFKD